jgi:hypothetical protein
VWPFLERVVRGSAMYLFLWLLFRVVIEVALLCRA